MMRTHWYGYCGMADPDGVEDAFAKLAVATG